MKNKIITPMTFDDYLAKKFENDSTFKNDYEQELARLQIGYRITKFREMRKLTQAQLAKRIKISQQAISRVEDVANSSINISTLIKIASALNASNILAARFCCVIARRS